MNNLNYILYAILFLLILNLYMGKKTESMTNLDESQKAEIKQLIYDNYKIDVNTIKNLSEIASNLQKDGLTIPGNLTVTGDIKSSNITNTGNIDTVNVKTTGNIKTSNIKILGNINMKDLIKLSKSDKNALKIQTTYGFVEFGSHISTDRPKFAFNKPIINGLSNINYMKASDKTNLSSSIESLNWFINNMKRSFDGYTFKPMCLKTFNDGTYVTYDTTCEVIPQQHLSPTGNNRTIILPVKPKLW
jgi:hypothetical protein